MKRHLARACPSLTVAILALLLLIAPAASDAGSPRSHSLIRPPSHRLACSPLPEPVPRLLATRRASDVALEWGAGPNADRYNVWKVVNGDKRLIPFATKLGETVEPAIDPVCLDLSVQLCGDPLAVPAPPDLVFYQVRGSCADGTEGPDSCTGVQDLWVSVSRPSIPSAATPQGSCASADLLPLRLQALALDAGGSPAAGCATIFFVDFSGVASCGRAFGEFCDGMVAVTDAGGVAEVAYTMTQADMDFCNCLPSTCDLSLCPTSCAPPCRTTPPTDLFCQLAFSAAGGSVLSGNTVLVEYGY